MRLSNMCILGVILILFILAAAFIYVELCCGQKPRRPNNHSRKSGNKSDRMSAAEIGVAASYISDSGGSCGGGDSGGDSGGSCGGGGD